MNIADRLDVRITRFMTVHHIVRDHNAGVRLRVGFLGGSFNSQITVAMLLCKPDNAVGIVDQKAITATLAGKARERDFLDQCLIRQMERYQF